uniref:Uncharacterized protein n=1 Tax=Anguilla anguilla TaxID=7936 RepID=A0A0E9SYB7_ANGAN
MFTPSYISLVSVRGLHRYRQT